MKKADYSKIAIIYDDARRISEWNIKLWMELISSRIDSEGKVEFLDLGCGTGRFSIPISSRLGYSVTGVDGSEKMLSKAKSKHGATRVKWDIQDASSLSYNDESFDVVFMSHLLHHTDDPVIVVEECNRVLKTGGIIMNRYGAIEDIRDDPEHRFFPETVNLDEARTPTVSQVEEWFRTAGFIDISSETIVQQTFDSGWDRLEKAGLKSTSVLTLIQENSFDHGLKSMQEYVKRNPNDRWLLLDKITLTSGKKS